MKMPQKITLIRLINYWSSSDSFSFKALRLETSRDIAGPFVPVKTYRDIPRCSVARTHDLQVPETEARYWRLFFLENYGGSSVGVYGIDFWAVDDQEAAHREMDDSSTLQDLSLPNPSSGALAANV